MLFDWEAREALRRGFNQFADLVRITLGPKGRHVVLHRPFGSPVLTNDGTTIAQEITVSDPFENMGVRLGREIGSRTLKSVGDGSTTATVLAQAFLEEGLAAVGAGADPMVVKQGMDAAAREAIRILEASSLELTPDQAGNRLQTLLGAPPNLCAEVSELLSCSDNHLFIDSVGMGSADVVLSPGMKIPAGYLSPYFVTDSESMDGVYEHTRILLTDSRIDSIEDLAGVTELCLGSGEALMLVCQDMSPDALATLVVQNLQQGAPIGALGLPDSPSEAREILEDLSLLTGARIISRRLGSPIRAESDDLGRARRVVAGREESLVMVSERTRGMEQKLDELQNLSSESELLLESRRRLCGSVVHVQVPGDQSDAAGEVMRWESELEAARRSLTEGVVAGGGLALVRAADTLEETDFDPVLGAGAQAVVCGLTAPLLQIAENSGYPADEVLAEVRGRGDHVGFDAFTCGYEDLTAIGVMDPLSCVRGALINAVSMAGLVLTTQTLVAETEDDSEAA